MAENTASKNHKYNNSINGGEEQRATPKQNVINALQKHSSSALNTNRINKAIDNTATNSMLDGKAGDIAHLTSQVASAYFQNNRVPASEVATVISAIHESLRAIKHDPQKKSVVSIDDSLTPDYIICLEDGKKLKMLKRHLRTNFNMSPTEYRAKWGLPPDYPMVAPNYANLRSQFAKQSGLGKEKSAKGEK